MTASVPPFPHAMTSQAESHADNSTSVKINDLPMHSETNLVVIAYVVGHGNHSPQAESLGYGHHSHPVRK